MCSGEGCIKYLLFFFNLVFSLSGLALIVVGALQLSNTSSFSELLEDVEGGIKGPQIFIIIVGVIIFFIATLGCCGAIQENRCMLITFAVFLLSIFIVELAVGIYALTHKDEFENSIQKGLSRQFERSFVDNNLRKVYEGMEKDFECCGVRGFSDYLRNSRTVPPSCCADKSGCRVRPAYYFTNGCVDALTNFTGKAGKVLGGVAIALSVLEIFGAVFALILAGRHR